MNGHAREHQYSDLTETAPLGFRFLKFLTLFLIVLLWFDFVVFLVQILAGASGPVTSTIVGAIWLFCLSLSGAMFVSRLGELFSFENFMRTTTMTFTEQSIRVMPVLPTLIWMDIWFTPTHSSLEMNGLLVSGIILAIAWVPLMRYYYLKWVW